MSNVISSQSTAIKIFISAKNVSFKILLVCSKLLVFLSLSSLSRLYIDYASFNYYELLFICVINIILLA